MTFALVLEQISNHYPIVNGQVDGLTIRTDIPNISSISASVDDYKILPGIRQVSLAEFNVSVPTDVFVNADDVSRCHELARQISYSKEINPLIVVVQKNDAYILEGVHRLGALPIVGVQNFPALIVVDMESFAEEQELDEQKQAKTFNWYESGKKNGRSI